MSLMLLCDLKYAWQRVCTSNGKIIYTVSTIQYNASSYVKPSHTQSQEKHHTPLHIHRSTHTESFSGQISTHLPLLLSQGKKK